MHTTDQLNTALAGKYAIERRIGEGGMAVVYLARDLKHNRHVALKVLNPELGAVLGGDRFKSEIEVTANLHHSNLLPLFDSGEAGGLLFYAMPFVEGETLRARLTRERQLGIDEAVRIATAVAGALDYAHRHHVIHRDLKPENILLHEGQPLVMDFGIALAVSKAGGARITQTGLSLGTPQYMSPEQATGDHSLDGRSDIYSLGAVLYEMLTGDPPHTGSTVQAVIAKVITEHPAPVRSTRPTVPEHVEAAAMMALAKVPADRFATAAEFASALNGERSVSFGGSFSRNAASFASKPGKRIRIRESAAWVLAMAGVATAAYFAMRPHVREQPLAQLAIEVPDSISIVGASAAQLYSVAISRDGRNVLFTGSESFGERSIFVREIGTTTIRKLPNVRGSSPKFSPNGDWILYVSRDNELMKVPTAGGTPRKLAAGSGSSSWGDDGNVYFQKAPWGSIARVDADGAGERIVATPVDSAKGVRFINVEMLPGSTHMLVRISQNDRSGTLGVVDLRTGKATDLGLSGWTPKYVEPGYLLYESDVGVLSAVRFSSRTRTISGEPVRIAEGVARLQNGGLDYAVARDAGTIVFRWRVEPTGGASPITLVDMRGAVAKTLLNDGRKYDEPRVSADGLRLLVRGDSKAYNTGDLWVLELASGAITPITRDDSSFRANWSRDGKRVIFMSGDPRTSRVRMKPWDGSGSDTIIMNETGIAEFSEGTAGGWSAVRTYAPRDIRLVPTDSVGRVSPRPFNSSAADETDVTISPSGTLLAYVSNESGLREVFVRPIPGPGPRVSVSIGGGVLPEWSADGRTLFYLNQGNLWAATIAGQPTLAVTRRDSLFAVNVSAENQAKPYTAMPNGRQFVITTGISLTANANRVAVLTGWQSLLNKR